MCMLVYTVHLPKHLHTVITVNGNRDPGRRGGLIVSVPLSILSHRHWRWLASSAAAVVTICNTTTVIVTSCTAGLTTVNKVGGRVAQQPSRRAQDQGVVGSNPFSGSNLLLPPFILRALDLGSCPWTTRNIRGPMGPRV